AWSSRSRTPEAARTATASTSAASAAVHARRAPVLSIVKPHAAAMPVAFAAPKLVAKDRSAWRLHELVDFDATTDVHAKTSDGRDLIIADADHALVVQRDACDMYVAWLVPNVATNDPRPLADLEAPAARIEGVTELTTSAHPAARVAPTGPAAIAITIDGHPKTTLTAATFAALATTRVQHKDTTVPAIELDKAFGRTALVAVEADGAPVVAEAPVPRARPVVFMNKRERFNFAWVDAAGKQVGDRHHEVTLVALRTR
ncbi:MAG TPA: hypothetical protein VFQ65_06520, partial [Kofleriaceae bacterium]|nr:hypothetical protein [Kofleriaceae bacterium]